MKAKAKTTTAAKFQWTEKQRDWLLSCGLMGREFYSEFRKRFKIPASKLSDQAIRARRAALYQQYA